MQEVRAFFSLLNKDLRLEFRTVSASVTSMFFILLLFVVSAVAYFGETDSGDVRLLIGSYWTALTFAGFLSLSRLWARERDSELFRGLVQLRIPLGVLFLAKSAALLLIVLSLALVASAIGTVVFGSSDLVWSSMWWSTTALFAIGFSLSASLFGALLALSRLGDLRVTSLVLPLLSPIILSAVVATREYAAAVPSAHVWLRLMGAYDLLVLSVGPWLFSKMAQP